MTQFLYNLELRIQTNGDGSTFTILGPEGSLGQLGEIIDKLKQWKFAVDDSARGDFIHFRAIPLDSTRQAKKRTPEEIQQRIDDNFFEEEYD